MSNKCYRSDFDFTLPKELIAQYPLANRSDSRLLLLDEVTGTPHDYMFRDLPQLLRADDLLVLNNTRVLQARLHGTKPTGGKVEILIEHLETPNIAIAQVRSSKTCQPGVKLSIDRGMDIQVLAKIGNLFQVQAPIPFSKIMEQYGHVPLPPYIHRSDENLDKTRYQTIYAQHEGAIAAPTAGLHFDADLLKNLADIGVTIAYVTLHVGAGTFQPVRSERLDDHVMHNEWCEVGTTTCEQVRATQAKGGRIIAVGTTSVRCLESASASGILQPYAGYTNLFIRPGYPFRTVDMLITNFHLPHSTLLMLVCAFSGTVPVLAAYHHAITAKYRFFSYGDAMLLTRTTNATRAKRSQ